MLGAVPVAAAACALLAALIHVYIFALESILWMRPRTRATFGVESEQAAATTRELAYNQGWYNLFLAIGTVIGLLVSRSPDVVTRAAGIGALLLALSSMVAAAIVLVVRSPALARAAVVQGAAPLAALVLLVVLAP